jgi:Methyltransferase FkbM domain
MAEIFITPGGIETSSLQKNPLRTEKENVVVRRLATFIEERGVDRVDLMKIDVESYEPRVLAGMGSYLHAMRPTIILEILNDEIGARVQPIIEGCEYLLFRLDENLGAVRVNELSVKGVGRHSRNFLLCSFVEARKLGLV